MVSDALSRSDDDLDPAEDEAALEGTSPLERAVRMPGYPYDENSEGSALPGGVAREPAPPAAEDGDDNDAHEGEPGARQLSDDERASQQQATFD